MENYGDARCRTCKNAKQRFGEQCYCTLYGIIIGYSKGTCRGYESEQVQEPEDNSGRDSV